MDEYIVKIVQLQKINPMGDCREVEIYSERYLAESVKEAISIIQEKSINRGALEKKSVKDKFFTGVTFKIEDKKRKWYAYLWDIENNIVVAEKQISDGSIALLDMAEIKELTDYLKIEKENYLKGEKE